MSAPPRFLNLDLTLKSNVDFTPLIAHLGQSVYVLHHQQHEQQFLLVLETSGTDSPDSTTCTRQFLTLIESLPHAASELWNSCTSRTFSYGFAGGRDAPALDTTIPTDLLLRIARLGADIGITVYPYRNDDADGSQRKDEPDALP